MGRCVDALVGKWLQSEFNSVFIENQGASGPTLKIAYLFPGQGSQHAGMGKELFEGFSEAREVFEEVDDALGFSLSTLCFKGPEEQLQLTENTQPAILTVSVAAARAMKATAFPEPSFVAGHSLGEYSALVTGGALSLRDAVQTVRARGRYMQEAVPVGTGAMAAVLGTDLETIERICAEVSGEGQVCSPANINAPNQVVIAGNTEAVERAGESMKSAGAKRVVKLNVSAPFHCNLMKPAQERLAFDIERIVFVDMKVPVVSNVDARPRTSASELRGALTKQVSSPVRWLESIEWLIDEGVGTFIEVGPGKVLSGLMRQISREVHCLNVADAETLQAAHATLTA
ncbi:MAG: ACP S-malonyltransferase [Pyrinomonadaceae bacterium]